MDKQYEAHYHELEERNWWFVARRDMICRMIEQMGLSKDAPILDIGCSGGALIRDLNALGYRNITGIDISSTAIALSRRRGIPNTFEMDGADPSFAPESFDLIIASDVLEHIEREGTAICSWKRLLRPRGRAIIFVPAFSFLWSEHDTVNHHFRRYKAGQLTSLLKSEEFKVTHSGYWNVLLFFPTALYRTIFKSRKSSSGQLLRLPALANQLLIRLLKIENVAVNRLSLPVGVSCFAVCQR